VSSDTCPVFAKSVVPFRQTKKTDTITIDTNEFQIGMSRQITATKMTLKRTGGDPKRKNRNQNKEPKINNAI